MRRTLTALMLAAFAALAGHAATKAPPAPVMVKLTTTDGVIVLELDRARAPITVENFVQYIKEKHYDGTIVHRVVPGFVIQGGGFDPKFVERPTRKPIKNESKNGLANLRGTIAMARETAPNSATAQFFINLADNRKLDTYGGGYAVFGKVVEGMEVVDAIAAIPTGPGGPFRKEVPFRNAVVMKAEIIAAPKPTPK